MIHAISVVNFKGETLRMELSKPEDTGMIIYEVTGIGAAKADINMSELATSDGARYNSARKTSRNIVLSIKLMENPTVEDSRHKVYKYFPTKKPLTLKFHTDSGTRVIDGYVESNEPIIFSSQEYTQISIICPDPNFYDERYTDMVLSGYISLFEFPFSNESLTENLIIFDEYRTTKRVSFVYDGEADTGVIVKIHANGEATNIRLISNDTGKSMFIDTSKFPSGIDKKLVLMDDVEISTYLGKRSAKLIRNGTTYNILNSLGRYPGWFTLTSGVNTFSYSAATGEKLIDVSFNYKNIYEGV